MTSAFLAALSGLSGVGTVREAALRERGIARVIDLLLLTPTRYRGVPAPCGRSELAAGASVAVVGPVLSARRARQRRGGTFLDLTIDLDGPLRVCFYNRGWLKDRVERGDRVLVTGRVLEAGGPVSGADLWVVSSEEHLGELLRLVIPVHPAVPKVAEGTLRRLLRQALDLVADEPDPLPAPVRERLGLAPLQDALRRIHEPSRGDDLGRAGERLLFDRLLAQSLVARAAAAGSVGPAPGLRSSPELRERIVARMPFELTPGQRAALDEVLDDIARPVAMRRLLLGDVGSGKTAVAAGALLAAVAAGAQALLVAPTDPLAGQHHATLERWLAGSRVRVALLSGRVSAADAALLRPRLAAGEVDIVIGTHAALSKSVRFRNLGLVVFDEQHRFGVMQRLSGRTKGTRPHMLALSATPIPRSLCLALFGELDITRVAGRPGGPRSVATRVVPPEDAFDGLRAAVGRGERGFVVFPSIEGASSPGVEREGRALARGPLAGIRTAFLHGALPVADQIAALDAFRSGQVSVLVSTVIVEVGLDVPEATVMVIQGADRFGLATLHQLRGRVGRGTRPGVAFLVPSSAPGGRQEGALERLRLLERESDGFRIAEADLELRGPGEWCGVRQHGMGGALPVGVRGDAPLIEAVDVAAKALMAGGYDPRSSTYYAALGRTLAGGFDPKDAV